MCHDAGSAASNALNAYVMPPHSSTGSAPRIAAVDDVPDEGADHTEAHLKYEAVG